MEKLKVIIALALVGFSLNIYAGDCVSMAGIYTIGTSETADFATIADAINGLKCGGVSGPVTFRLESGVYNEKVAITSIPGLSAMNSVRFESKSGSNTETIIRYTNADATLVLAGVSYISFENLTIDHKTATYGNCARIEGKSNNLRFKGVIFNGVEVARTGSNSATVYFLANATRNHINFEDCEINNGSTGITKGGESADACDTKTSITGTLFFNQYEAALALVNEDAPVITNNVVSTLSTYSDFKAMSLDNILNNVILSNNIVTVANGSVGLALNNCLAQADNPGQISNNSFAVGGEKQSYGVYVTGNTDNQVFNFNRIKLTINGKEGTNQAYYRNLGTGNNINLMNNIMYDLNAGGYTIVGNTYKDAFNRLPAQSNPTLSVSANGIMIEKVTPVTK